MPNPYRDANGRFASKGAGGGGRKKKAAPVARKRMAGTTTKGRALTGTARKAWTSTANNAVGRSVRRVDRMRANRSLAANGGTKETRSVMHQLRGVPRAAANRVAGASTTRRRMAGTQSKSPGLLRARNVTYGERYGSGVYKWGTKTNRKGVVTAVPGGPRYPRQVYRNSAFDSPKTGRGLHKPKRSYATQSDRNRATGYRETRLGYVRDTRSANKSLARVRNSRGSLTAKTPARGSYYRPIPKQGVSRRGSLLVANPKPKRSRKKR